MALRSDERMKGSGGFAGTQCPSSVSWFFLVYLSFQARKSFPILFTLSSCMSTPFHDYAFPLRRKDSSDPHLELQKHVFPWTPQTLLSGERSGITTV